MVVVPLRRACRRRCRVGARSRRRRPGWSPARCAGCRRRCSARRGCGRLPRRSGPPRSEVRVRVDESGGDERLADVGDLLRVASTQAAGAHLDQPLVLDDDAPRDPRGRPFPGPRAGSSAGSRPVPAMAAAGHPACRRQPTPSATIEGVERPGGPRAPRCAARLGAAATRSGPGSRSRLADARTHRADAGVRLATPSPGRVPAAWSRRRSRPWVAQMSSMARMRSECSRTRRGARRDGAHRDVVLLVGRGGDGVGRGRMRQHLRSRTPARRPCTAGS